MPYKNIDPNLWGSSLWNFLHYLSLAYPENPTTDEQEILYNFLSSMQKIIPCEKCRKNFLKHLDAMEVEVLTSRTNFVRWLFIVHNLVNKDTGKPNFSYDEFIKKYSQTNEVNGVTNRINGVTNGINGVTNRENGVTNKEYFDIIAKNRNLENIVLTLNQEIKTIKNRKSGFEYFNLSSNTIISGMILVVIIIIVLINRKN